MLRQSTNDLYVANHISKKGREFPLNIFRMLNVLQFSTIPNINFQNKALHMLKIYPSP